MSIPKVLIFGQPFNSQHGGGITLSNLFRGWDKDRIAVAAKGHVMNNLTTEICDIYFQLGTDEYKWRFPFRLLQRQFKSGLKQLNSNSNSTTTTTKIGFRYKLVNNYFYPALEWFGLFHNTSCLELSDGFKIWLSEFNPDLLYLQVTSRDEVLFAKELIDYLKIPAAIHIMDDWPSTISRRGPFKKFWGKKIDKEFRQLLDKIDLFLSISDAMSFEYKKRYNKNFIAFHNPIDTHFWTQKAKGCNELTKDHIKVLFSGRIGIGVADSLLDLAKVVEDISHTEIKIKLYVQSPSKDKKILDKLSNFQSLIINPFADYSKLPGIFSSADVLVIVNDFDNKSINYLRYSMPTKASEYMISGIPVLVYSHAETAVTRFFSTNRCGYCVTERNLAKLKDALILLIKDEKLRRDLSNNAVHVAKQLFDEKIVRTKFQDLIKNTSLMAT